MAEERGLCYSTIVANDDERKNQIQEPVEPEPPTLLEKFNLNKAMGAMKEGDGVIGSVAEVNLDSHAGRMVV